jgi:diacylglycerol kinase family enzyme
MDDQPTAVKAPAPALQHGDERLLILANRRAGGLSRLREEESLEGYACQAGINADVVFTRNPSQLRQILREQVIGKRHKVAVAGGDGTIHCAVQELACTDTVLGILPQGTANNFATALRLPRDLPSAFRVIAEGEERSVSLGKADKEYFTEGAGAGIFAEVLALTSGTHGAGSILRALRVVARATLTGQMYRFMLEIDGVRRSEEVFSVTVANSFCVGYNLPIAPFARLTDTELDVILVGALTRSEIFSYYKAVRAQTHLNLPKVESLRAQEVVIDSRRHATVHVDDRVHRRTPVTIRIVPEALRVMVDRL